MKSKMLYVAMVMAVIEALVVTNSPAVTAEPQRAWNTEFTESNLNGKMFTLSYNGGGISFFPPYYSPTPSSWPYSTPYFTSERPRPRPRPTSTSTPRPRPRPRPTSTFTPRPTTTTTTKPTTTTRPRPTTTYPPWTTPPSTRGVSVCLRYLTDYLQTSSPTIFTLSPSSRSLELRISYPGPYILTLNGRYYSLYMKPDIRFWPNVGPDIWTRVCLTVDSIKKVAQIFSGANISIRKRLPIPYVWTGEPVIHFSDFDGQVTDVQMWDYPISYKEIFNYMTNGIYVSYSGSVLTWSSINYSPRGDALLEDVYEWGGKKPISSRRRGKEERKTKEFFDVGEMKRDQL